MDFLKTRRRQCAMESKDCDDQAAGPHKKRSRDQDDTSMSYLSVKSDCDTCIELSVIKFAESRARELEALSHNVEEVSGSKLSFQRLPHHMRRRAMSHNIRRIPRRLRMKAQHELEKRTINGKVKLPSRKHRRRPGNLLSDYMRRQRQNVWLGTHIWHAKRFKMVTEWGYRLAYRPCDKNLRACYRSTRHHCLLQDISFECCIEMQGDQQLILAAFSHVTSKDTGLTIGAKVTLSGQRWGQVMLYAFDQYPQDAAALVCYHWQPVLDEVSEAPGSQHSHEPAEHKLLSSRSGNDGVGLLTNGRSLWVWCHPSAFVTVWSLLHNACGRTCLSSAVPEGNGQSDGSDGDVFSGAALEDTVSSVRMVEQVIFTPDLSMRSLKDCLVKFRLTGPASTRILSETLLPASVCSSDPSPAVSSSPSAHLTRCHHWWMVYYGVKANRSAYDIQRGAWEKVIGCDSLSSLPRRAVFALTVRDPRIALPSHCAASERLTDVTGGFSNEDTAYDKMPVAVAVSPIWNQSVRDGVTELKISEQEINKRRSALFAPGSTLNLGDEESRIPVLLLHHPGRECRSSRIGAPVQAGVGCGWDIIIPNGWAMAFWIPLVYSGARVGGLREARNLSTRAGQLHFPDDFLDTPAGRRTEERDKEQLVTSHVRCPPAKRVNFRRICVSSAFCLPFPQLVEEWVRMVSDILSVAGHCENLASDDSLNSADTPHTGATCTPAYHVLRCRLLLQTIQSSRTRKRLTSSTSKTNSLVSDLVGKADIRPLILRHVHSVVPVLLICLRRGVPRRGATICIPTKEDICNLESCPTFTPREHLHEFEEQVKSKQPKRKKRRRSNKATGPTLTEPGRGSDSDGGVILDNTRRWASRQLSLCQLSLKRELLAEPPLDLVCNADRPVLGFIMNGSFDLGLGQGSGIGMCSLAGLLVALNSSQLVLVRGRHLMTVLFRNPTSRQYRFAHLYTLV